MLGGLACLAAAASTGLAWTSREKIALLWLCHRIEVSMGEAQDSLIEAAAVEGQVEVIPALFEVIRQAKGRAGVVGRPFLEVVLDVEFDATPTRAIDAMLCLLGRDCIRAEQLLVRQLAEEDVVTKVFALRALRGLAGCKSETLRVAAKCLDDDNPVVVWEGCRLMRSSLWDEAVRHERSTADARGADLAVQRLRGSEPGELEREIDHATTCGASVIPFAVALLRDRNVFLRRAALEVLQRVGLVTTEAIQAARDAVEDSDCIVSRRAQAALAAVGQGR